jgi:hypothetical protein
MTEGEFFLSVSHALTFHTIFLEEKPSQAYVKYNIALEHSVTLVELLICVYI